MTKNTQVYLSPLLAQKALLDNDGNSNNGSGTLAAPSFNSSIKDTPSFHTPNGSNERSEEDYGLPLNDIIATLSRKAKSVYERYLISEQGRELIAKATEYEIPFNIREVNFLELRDQIEEFEEAIEKAASVGVDWKEFGYDLIGIEQEIASFEEAENDYLHVANSVYWSDRVVGA